MGSHVLVINRFDNELGEYHRYIDHGTHAVSYVTTPNGAAPLDHAAAEAIIVVPDLSDTDDVVARAGELAERFGAFDHVITLSEFDLDLGAVVREALPAPGPDVADIRRVRDKVVMKTLVGAAGLRVPRWDEAVSTAAVRAFAAEIGFPLILKPRCGWDSQGVLLVRSPEALELALKNGVPEGYECEEFVDGTMYHVDGVARDGEVQVLRATRLLVSCLDFALGTPSGSVANDDAELERRIASFAQQVIGALGVETSAFHLEIFRTRDAPGDDGFGDLVFLEIGARVGGAQIPWVWREVYGIDLLDTWVRMLLGESPELPPVGVGVGDAGGYLLMPEPPERPCRVVRVHGATGVPEVYARLLPEEGAVLNGTGGARETGGAYRFRAPDAARVESAIGQVIARHRIEWAAVDGDEPAGPARPGPGRAQAVVHS